MTHHLQTQNQIQYWNKNNSIPAKAYVFLSREILTNVSKRSSLQTIKQSSCVVIKEVFLSSLSFMQRLKNFQ